MQKIISCDWGTSALRLSAIDTGTLAVLAEVQGEQGIAATFDLWEQSGRKEEGRLSFYQSILAGQISRMEEQSGVLLQDTPLIISGMASSNIGMMELPYAEIPFSTSGHDLCVKKIEATAGFKHATWIVSGVRKDNDAMRGEETQLIGCLDSNDTGERLFVFPGTHSKHIIVKDGKATDFNTFMTGEFFELLSKKSILSGSVEESRNILDGNNLQNFESGVADSFHLNLLHTSFLVRTNYLFDKLSKQGNYFYLSGLLTGTELKDLTAVKMPLTIVSNELLAKLYSVALRQLGIHTARHQDAGKATIEGHCRIYDLYKP
jgi:2-dehydro-3-deoxygalactonokinase